MFCLGTHTGSGHNAGASGAPAGQGAGTGAGHTVGGGGETAWLGRHKRNALSTRTHNSPKRGRRGSSYCAYRLAPMRYSLRIAHIFTSCSPHWGPLHIHSRRGSSRANTLGNSRRGRERVSVTALQHSPTETRPPDEKSPQ